MGGRFYTKEEEGYGRVGGGGGGRQNKERVRFKH